MDKQKCLEILNQKIDEAQEETDRSPEGSSYGTLMLGRKQAFSDVRGLLKTLDEPEITTEQAWEKIAEKFEEGPKELCATLVSALPPYNLSEKPEIPKFVADWIEEKRPYYSLMTMVGNYLNGFGMPERLEEWITDNKDDYLKALVIGYTIEKEPVWVVLKDAQYFHAFTGEYDESESFEYVLAMYEGHAHTFTDKQKAEAVATLVDGTVKEWSE
ncbi:DUF1642 domain-containing protein [Tetragenococcus halophilus]|uniref:DUF1642 domain-containing protein n=1 Tax=Tetragenococcus halophilus TaxID=51669 RepID=A0AB35HMH1_TETHA|nr:DUF1642 domain-containing protein [Tetragenococcus halophilus]MCO8297315.1 DUF1642 domain-containing protein [Tetragenococcus halophilus]